MRNEIFLTLVFLITLTSCFKKEDPAIIGSWSLCLYDGRYKEFKITETYTTTTVSTFIENDWDDGISFYKCRVEDSLLVVTAGINVDLLITPEVIEFKPLYRDRMLIMSWGETSELTRLAHEIPEIDSTNFDVWRNEYLRAFLNRAENASCPDLRTEEEKQLRDLGEVEDDFEPIYFPGDSIEEGSN